MSKNRYILFLTFLNLTLTSIAFLSILGKIRFGFGLGDVFLFLAIIVILIVFDVLAFLSFKPKNYFFGKKKIILVFGGLSLFWLLLQMTIFRGDLSPWDGQVFWWYWVGDLLP